GIVDGFSLAVMDGGECGIGGHGHGQLHQLAAGKVQIPRRHAAADEDNIEAMTGKRARDDRRATQMADAEQVLHIEEDAAHLCELAFCTVAVELRGRFSAESVREPSAATAKICRANSISRCGGLPTIGQPVANAERGGVHACWWNADL